MKPIEGLILGGVVLVICLLMVVTGVRAFTLVKAKAECLQAGYPSAQIDFYLEAYCIRRLDQTDVVEPLEKIRRERS